MVRQMLKEDIPSCAEIFISLFSGFPWYETWCTDTAIARLTAYFENSRAYGEVATDDSDALLGFAIGSIEPWQDTHQFYLREVCVRFDLQHHGIGSELMRSLMETLTKRDITAIYLLTGRRIGAPAFYEKLGFSRNEEIIMMGRDLAQND